MYVGVPARVFLEIFKDKKHQFMIMLPIVARQL